MAIFERQTPDRNLTLIPPKRFPAVFAKRVFLAKRSLEYSENKGKTQKTYTKRTINEARTNPGRSLNEPRTKPHRTRPRRELPGFPPRASAYSKFSPMLKQK